MDGGDSLFAGPDLPKEEARKQLDKASLILSALSKLGYKAMAVGEKDLAAGLPFLLSSAEKASLQLLGANLARMDGTHPFQDGIVISVQELKVGLFAVASRGASYERFGLQVSNPVTAAQDQAAKLRGQGAALVVALLHMPAFEASALVQAVPDLDLAVVSHEGRALLTYPKSQADGSADGRGRQLGRADLELQGTGPFVAIASAKDELALLDQNIVAVKDRMKQSPQMREALEKTLVAFQQRRDGVFKRMSEPLPAGRRWMTLQATTLDTSVADDAVLAALVKAFVEKNGSTVAAH